MTFSASHCFAIMKTNILKREYILKSLLYAFYAAYFGIDFNILKIFGNRQSV